MGKGRSPSRMRYEAAHPTLTARVPAKVKAELETVLDSEGTTFSEWVRQQAAGASAVRREEDAARQAGYAVGLAEGRAQARAAYLILSAAMLWDQYGEQVGDTNDAWIDRRAQECARDLRGPALSYLLDRIGKTPSLRAPVDRWLQDSGLRPLPPPSR